MSVRTSDTTANSSIRTEACNLNTINASAAQRDGSPSAIIPANTAENRQIYLDSLVHLKK